MRRPGLIGLVALAMSCLATSAPAAQIAFVSGGRYNGRTSQGGKIRILVAADGKTARVHLGVTARCRGRGTTGQLHFVATFEHNPARIHGATMSVGEVDRHVPPMGNLPAARIERQHFVAHATGTGTTLVGTYLTTGTLKNGVHCRSGHVHFSAAIR